MNFLLLKKLVFKNLIKMKSSLTVVPLHLAPQYFEKAYELLNKEWERKDESWYIWNQKVLL